MAKHLNRLEKELLIRKFKSHPSIKVSDFCYANSVSESAFKKWLKQYEEGCLEALARADSSVGEVFPEGVDRTEEAYKREILRLRIENERLKKICGEDERVWRNGICSFKNEEFKIVNMLSKDYAVTDICAMMGVSRSGYYKWLRRDPSS
jgi:transposase-like protein